MLTLSRKYACILHVSVVLAALGCEKKQLPQPSERHEPVDPAKLARALGKDAADLTPPVDPPPSSGDMKADLEHFTTLDACVTERTQLDPVVGDALLAIGYDTFLRDACRVLDATKTKDARRCGPIEASSLRARCEANVAIAAGLPDACPFDIAGDKTRGHDPTCVAVSLRDARLCAGESRPKRGTCEALASGDEKKCDAALEAERRGCHRDAARWRSLLTSQPNPPAGKLPAPAGTLTLKGEGGAPDPPHGVSDLALEVERGLVLVREMGGFRIRVGSLQELGAIPHAGNPVARPRIGFELVALHDAPTEARIEHLELEIPGAITVVMPAMRTTLKAQITKLEKTRGGEARITVDGTAGSAPHVYAVHTEITTFVRDLVGVR